MQGINDTEELNEKRPKNKKSQESKTPMLDSFGRDMTLMASEDKLDPVVGREIEMDRVIEVLGRRKKNNPVLVGEAGVGKTAIAEGIAQKIVKKETSRILFDKRLISLDMSSLVAGTKYRGEFEERMKVLIEEIEANDDIIIFIDEIHTIIGAGNSSGALDVSNMLKPALARGTIQCIGATTLDEYKKSVERDNALERRFQKIIIDPPNSEETEIILENIKDRYELYHNVDYTKEAIEACVKYSDRYISNRFFPDKAIDILDTVGSRMHMDNIQVPEIIIELETELGKIDISKKESIKKQDFEEAASCRDEEKLVQEKLYIEKEKWHEECTLNRIKITEDDIAKVVSRIIGIPVTKITANEGKRLIAMPEYLKKEVIGQDEAVERVSEAVQRSRANLQNPNRPIGSFIFLGSTGVGKTELCKVLADYLFDSRDSLIKLDMSEYMEGHSVSKMIGSPPGYVGYDEGGQLTEKVRNKPYSVVLFDEIEKAHPEVSNILLQILDEGKLTDALGRTVDFKNTVIIMTSNVGSKELSENKPLGFNTGVGADINIISVVEKALKKKFKPEFLNRIDEQVIFKQLSKENTKDICEIHLKELFERVNKLGYSIEATDALKNYLVDEGYSVEFGARPISRAITKYVQNPISKELLLSKFKKGDTIVVDYDKKTNLPIVKKKTKKK